MIGIAALPLRGVTNDAAPFVSVGPKTGASRLHAGAEHDVLAAGHGMRVGLGGGEIGALHLQDIVSNGVRVELGGKTGALHFQDVPSSGLQPRERGVFGRLGGGDFDAERAIR